MKENPIYLTVLNGLRAIAPLSVVLAHVSQEGIADFGFPRLFDLPMAGYGVTLFFVISGFLITFLLLIEIKKTDTVAVSKFSGINYITKDKYNFTDPNHFDIVAGYQMIDSIYSE